MIDHGIVAFE